MMIKVEEERVGAGEKGVERQIKERDWEKVRKGRDAWELE